MDDYENCDTCTKPMEENQQGSSWAEIFDHGSMEPLGTRYRCRECTERHGQVRSNASPPSGNMAQYEGILK